MSTASSEAMAYNNSFSSSGMSSCSTSAATSTPWASPETFLEASIPGFSLISGLAKSYFNLELTAILAYAVPVAALVAAFRYFYDPVSVYVMRYGVSTAEIRFEDEMYNYVMYWLSQQQFSANTLSFVAGTKTSSDMTYDYYEEDKDNDSRDQEVETDWQLAEDNFDKYWAQLTNRDRIKPIYFTPCDGTHWFKYKGQYVAFTRSSSERNMGRYTTRTETLYLTCLGRDPALLKELLRETQQAYSDRDGSSTIIYRKVGDTDDWQRCMARPPRPLSTVVLDKGQKESIVEDIKEYLHPLTKRWYANRGIPYRRGYLLYGPPGTGKTSLCVALAGMFNLKVYVASLNSRTLTEEGLATLFGLLPTRCVILLEDVDSAGITHKRAADLAKPKDKDDDDAKSSTGKDSTPSPSGISLSALLNVIDGVASKEGRILIMTTNHVEKLDPALLRPGRVDMSISFGNATTETASELFKSTYVSREEDYPQSSSGGEKKAPLKRRIALSEEEISAFADVFASKLPSGEFSPADIQGYLLKHKSTPQKAAEGVEDWIVKTRVEKEKQRNSETQSEEICVPKLRVIGGSGRETPETPPVIV